jgi:hypothetical protein
MPVAYPPEPKGVHIGQDVSEDVLKRIAAEGARTIPGREHGGNCDVCWYFSIFVSLILTIMRQIKNLSKYADGRQLSMAS